MIQWKPRDTRNIGGLNNDIQTDDIEVDRLWVGQALYKVVLRKFGNTVLKGAASVNKTLDVDHFDQSFGDDIKEIKGTEIARVKFGFETEIELKDGRRIRVWSGRS